MKISFPNWSLGVLLANKQLTWCIISLICLLVVSYLVGRYVGLLVILLLGIAGIVIVRAANARLNSNNSDRVEMAPSWNDAPQITTGWDYRPRRALRRCADVNPAAETTEDPSSRHSAINENVWFNALDSAVDPEPTVEEATEKSPLSDSEPSALNSNVWGPEDACVNA
jgi:hypothetical protein